MGRGAPTRAEKVYEALRADILAGRCPPGARLPFAELASRFTVSMGVAREALTRLGAEGLVESQPQRGFRVVPLSEEDLRHLTEARGAIEGIALRQAFQHGGVDWEATVLAAAHRLQGTPQMAPDDPDRMSDAWAAAHRCYHVALLAGCPNPRLLAVATSLRDAAELYRRWSVPGHGHRDIAGEHQALLKAVLARDEKAAGDLLSRHIEHTTEVLLAQLDRDRDRRANQREDQHS